MGTESDSSSQSARAEMAFAIYQSLGDQRTYKEVAAQMGVALATIKRWAKAGNWQFRLHEELAKAARELHDRYTAGLIAQNERNLKIVRAALMSLAKDVSERKIKGQYSDIARLLQLEKELMSAERPASEDGPPQGGGVFVYLPDNGRDPGLQKIYTKDELRQKGHNL